MFSVKIGERVLRLPDYWHEVTLDAYNRLTTWDGKDINQLLVKITGVGAFSLADTEKLHPLINRMSWLAETPVMPELGDTVRVGEKVIRYPERINTEPFQCKVMMDKNLRDHAEENLTVSEATTFTLAAFLYEPYYGKHFSIHRINDVNNFMSVTGQMSVLEALPLGKLYHEQGIELTEKWNRALSGGEYTSEQLRAGVKKFEKYGVWGMVQTLTGKLHLSREQIMQLPYDEVFLSLLYDKESADYQNKLHKILNPKPKKK